MTLLISLFLPVGSSSAQVSGYSLRFYGNGVDDIDRVKIQIDDPSNNEPGPPADVGGEDFTIEFWMRASASENTAAGISCGQNYDWINGNTLLDRDRFGQGRAFGLSIAGGVVVFGVNNEDQTPATICGTTMVLDEQWHHIAVQRRRSDGWLWLYVDGVLEAEVDGPDGDLSYPDDGTPCSDCCGNLPTGPSCNDSDPFLVIGAEKHDAGSDFPSYSGWVDEVRLSNTLRYTDNFTPPVEPFVSDENTVALYHFDEGTGDTINDSSGAVGGPSDGVRKFGGSPPGPEWSTETPFDAVVPVTLASFFGKVTDQGYVMLRWTTRSEIGNYGFVVQRSRDAPQNFRTLPNSFVAGGGTTDMPRTYTFVDSTVTVGRWWYRLKQTDLDGGHTFYGPVYLDVSTNDAIPINFSLGRNYPNPFTATTTLQYSLPRRAYVLMKVFSIRGEGIVTLVDKEVTAGFHLVSWDGRDSRGRSLPSGIYLCTIEADGFVSVRRVVLLR